MTQRREEQHLSFSNRIAKRHQLIDAACFKMTSARRSQFRNAPPLANSAGCVVGKRGRRRRAREGVGFRIAGRMRRRHQLRPVVAGGFQDV